MSSDKAPFISRVSIKKCATYGSEETTAAVKEAVSLLGGMERFVRPGSRVLLKPNLLSARAPEEGVDTHPEIVRAVARLVKPITPHIFVGDSPGGWELRDIEKVYEKSGVKAVCEDEGLRLVKFDKPVETKGYPIASVITEVDSIISISKLKTHSTAILTGAIKNTFGAVVGLHKAQCHLRAPMPAQFASVLADVLSIVKPALSIMDGVIGMEGEGPAAGNLRNFGLILASADAVALDSVFAMLAGLDPLRVPMIYEAQKRGLGTAELKKIEVLGENAADIRIRNLKLPKTSLLFNLPRPLIALGIKAIKFYPRIDRNKCAACGLCANICARAAVKKTGNKKMAIDTDECIRCFCCHEVCTYNAITLYKSFLFRMISSR